MGLIKHLAATLLMILPALAADSYQIDPVHSEVSFRIRHLGIAKVYGRFSKFAGTITLDEKDLSKSGVDVSIEAASVNTDNAMRDKDLLSANFFDTGKYPLLTFKSVAVKEVSKGNLEVLGDFTLHGTTRRITIPVVSTGSVSTPKGVRAGFEGTLTLSRYDYGMNYMSGVVGEDVTITLGIEAVKTETKP